MGKVQFILGRAGSGKSQQIISRITETLRQEPDHPIILLVPEQASYNYEFQLSADPQIGALLSVSVLSFERLAWTVLQQVGGSARTLMSDMGKLMILRQEILNARQNIHFLKGAADKPGQLQAVAEMISEFKRYGYSPDDLARLSQEDAEQESILGMKLLDLQMIYSGYAERLAQQGMDSDDTLDLLYQKLGQWQYLREADIYIDDFDGFTPQEMKIVKLLMVYGRLVTIALTKPLDLCADRFILQQVFAEPLRTEKDLRDAAKELGVEILPDILCAMNYRQQSIGELAYLEAHYFDLSAPPYRKPAAHLQVIEGHNIQSEVEYVAGEIRRLCREEGYHYADIAIFLRDLTDYEVELQNVLADYDIPFFLDQRQPILHHPLLELILAAIAIDQENWSYAAVFRYLKSDLARIDRGQRDELENYILAFGIKGYHWRREQPWQYQKRYTIEADQAVLWSAEDLQQINAIRFAIAEPLKQFHRELHEALSCAEMVAGVYHLLMALGVSEQLQGWAEQAEAGGRQAWGEIHKQLWDKVVDVFDQMVLISGDMPLTVAEFQMLVETGFQNIDLGMIPTNLDQVQIGALNRSRSHSLKAVFLLGVNEGLFPGHIKRTGILNETERRLLEQWGMPLSANDTEELLREEYLIYLAISRPSERLYLSYALSDQGGKGRRPSAIIRRVNAIVPQVQKRVCQWPPDLREGNGAAMLEHPAKALSLLGSALLTPQDEEQKEIWLAVYDWLLHSPYCERLGQMLQGIFYQHQPEPLPKKLTDELYQPSFRLSVSGIEKYQQCPYAHFLTYGLQLKERLTYELESFDVGQFYHKAMERLYDYMREQRLSWRMLDEQEVKRIVSQIVDELAPQLQNEILLSSGRYQYIKRKLGMTLEQSIQLMAYHGRRGVFEPLSVETSFGGSRDLPGLVLPITPGISAELVGRIDRIEGAMTDVACYLRVIDFKTGTKGLSLAEIYYGLKIQLLVYLNVIMQYYQQRFEGKFSVRPAGIFYYFFKNPLIKSDTPLSSEEIKQEIMKEMMPSGLVLADLVGLRLADEQLSVGKSLMLPITLKKEAEDYLNGTKPEEEIPDILDLFDRRSSAVVSGEQMALLERYAEQLMVKVGQQMVQGNIAISPCALKNFSSCQYCTFRSICQIDLSVEDQTRALAPLDQEEIWNAMKEAVDNG